MSETHLVTGAFGYSGRYLARRLLDAGVRVRTLTNTRPDPDPFDGRVEASPLCLDDASRLEEGMRGARVLYNTYWVRFDHGGTTHARAVAGTRVLFEAARRAGVERIVHVSITNPSPDSPLPYFRGKAELEGALRSLGISHAIVRPTVLFGREDILVNNICYLLRRLPVFGVPGSGRYGIQPVYVDDLAGLMAELGRSRDDLVVDAVGPETYEYVDMVRLLRGAVRSRALVMRVPPSLVLVAGRILGRLLGDVVITADEIRGLSSGLLVSRDPPTCGTSFRRWVERNAEHLGTRYASELSRHFATAGRAGAE
jgi:NADH dehydrogenase